MTAPATDHRKRLLDALESTLAEKRYREITLTDLTSAARVSRRSFYEHFPNKDECLLSLARDTSQRIMQRIISSYSPSDDWPKVVSNATSAYMNFVDQHPSLMYALYIEVAALGHDGFELRRDIAGTFARFLSAQTVQRAEAGELPETLSEAEAIALVAGINELLFQRLMEQTNNSQTSTLTETRSSKNRDDNKGGCSQASGLVDLEATAQRLILRMTQ